MTAAQPVLDGMPATLAESDWVLVKRCGCPIGVATGAHHPTEDEAWEGFYLTWKQIAKALQRGERLELMPHAAYRTRVMPRLMKPDCQHEEGR